MTKFLTILFTAAILQAHMIKDAFLDTRQNSPDSTVTQLLTSTVMPARPLISPSIDSLAPNNLCLNTRVPGNYAIPMVVLPRNDALTSGHTFMGWFRTGTYSAAKLADNRLRGFCVARSVLGGNAWGDSTQVWLELNKTRTQLTLIYARFTRPSKTAPTVWTIDSIKSNVFAPLETNRYNMISYTHPLLSNLWDSTLIKIKFYINGTPCGTVSKASFGTVCMAMPQTTAVGNYINLNSMWLEQPDSGFATGGAITYKRELTAAQIKAVYDTNQTHNLRYQRSLTSAVELATAKAPSSINCMSINPTAVQFPGNVLQVISVEGRVLHTMQNTTGKVILPELSAGRYFLKADNIIKPIFILN